MPCLVETEAVFGKTDGLFGKTDTMYEVSNIYLLYLGFQTDN